MDVYSFIASVLLILVETRAASYENVELKFGSNTIIIPLKNHVQVTRIKGVNFVDLNLPIPDLVELILQSRVLPTVRPPLQRKSQPPDRLVTSEDYTTPNTQYEYYTASNLPDRSPTETTKLLLSTNPQDGDTIEQYSGDVDENENENGENISQTTNAHMEDHSRESNDTYDHKTQPGDVKHKFVKNYVTYEDILTNKTIVNKYLETHEYRNIINHINKKTEEKQSPVPIRSPTTEYVTIHSTPKLTNSPIDYTSTSQEDDFSSDLITMYVKKKVDSNRKQALEGNEEISDHSSGIINHKMTSNPTDLTTDSSSKSQQRIENETILKENFITINRSQTFEEDSLISRHTSKLENHINSSDYATGLQDDAETSHTETTHDKISLENTTKLPVSSHPRPTLVEDANILDQKNISNEDITDQEKSITANSAHVTTKTREKKPLLQYSNDDSVSPASTYLPMRRTLKGTIKSLSEDRRIATDVSDTSSESQYITTASPTLYTLYDRPFHDASTKSPSSMSSSRIPATTNVPEISPFEQSDLDAYTETNAPDTSPTIQYTKSSSSAASTASNLALSQDKDSRKTSSKIVTTSPVTHFLQTLDDLTTIGSHDTPSPVQSTTKRLAASYILSSKLLEQDNTFENLQLSTHELDTSTKTSSIAPDTTTDSSKLKSSSILSKQSTSTEPPLSISSVQNNTTNVPKIVPTVKNPNTNVSPRNATSSSTSSAVTTAIPLSSVRSATVTPPTPTKRPQRTTTKTNKKGVVKPHRKTRRQPCKGQQNKKGQKGKPDPGRRRRRRKTTPAAGRTARPSSTQRSTITRASNNNHTTPSSTTRGTK